MDLKRLSAAFLWVLFASIPASAQPELSGIWVLEGRAGERELVLTREGERIKADYDLLNDDPSLNCVPASLSRIWANPNSRIEIIQTSDRVLINYELFDLRREIPLGDDSVMPEMPSTKNISGQYFQEMGSSFGRYDADKFIVETRNHSPGYIRTSRGIPQSEQSVATEEFWRDGDILRLQLTYVDETLFHVPFVLDHAFRKVENEELLTYNCTGADYDWFEKLNAPQEK